MSDLWENLQDICEMFSLVTMAEMNQRNIDLQQNEHIHALRYGMIKR